METIIHSHYSQPERSHYDVRARLMDRVVADETLGVAYKTVCLSHVKAGDRVQLKVQNLATHQCANYHPDFDSIVWDKFCEPTTAIVIEDPKLEGVKDGIERFSVKVDG